MRVGLRSLTSAAAACLLVVALAGKLEAKPAWGGSCGSCHTGAADMEVDPTLPILDLGGPNGALKTYTVLPGETVALKMNVLDGATKYAGELKRLDQPGLGGTTLVFTADPSWTNFGTYFTWPSGGGVATWTGPTTLTYLLGVDASTPLDVYDLEFAVGVKGGGLRYDDEHFYLNVVPEPGALLLLTPALTGLGICLYRRRRKTV